MVAADGEPIAPTDVKQKFVKQCGVIVRDFVPITIQEWNKPKDRDLTWLGDESKKHLFQKVMHNFTLPWPEVDPEEGEPSEEQMDKLKKELVDKVKAWALKKMAELFNKYKKRLYTDYVLKGKTPDFDRGYEKIRDYWDEFVAYKKSEAALAKSEINKANAAKKKYHHNMGPGGYARSMPKWDKMEKDLLDQGIVPEPIREGWIERSRNWFYGHGGTLNASTGDCIYNQRHKDQPLLPIDDIRKAVKDVEEGRFRPERENDELARALGNPEHEGRTRGTSGSKPWAQGFPVERKLWPDRSHMRRKVREQQEEAEKADRLRALEEGYKRQQEQIDRLSQQGTLALSQQHVDAAAPSNRRSSVASSRLVDDDDPLRRYPVDDITETTTCEGLEVA